jgi:polar amino acid transport system substrate-binding protein
MKQLAQKLGGGQVTVEEVPIPACAPGMVVIQNYYSVISAGTEAATVRTAQSNLLYKARHKRKELRQVLEICQRQGPAQAYRAVMKRLDAYSPLGYSSAGEIIAAGAGVREFSVGDLAAAGGVGYANHAEIISAPANLCVKLPPNARTDHAAYNTLGAIALQGIRQADTRLGESCVVIGLGLIGQLTCLMLRAAGVRTFGIDVEPFAVNVARKHACDGAWLRSDPGLAERVEASTGGIGADAVIITAATSSTDPINFAGRLARKRGRIVVVGAVPTGFDRDPYWYRKELELRMSCSYGPGRYDPTYEQKGIDYPVAYVRWSEKRNMSAFQELVHNRRIDLSYLTTHEFSLENAPRAYDLVVERKEAFLGVLLRYNPRKPVTTAPIRVCTPARQGGRIGLAFIGAGSYAQSYLLPNLPTKDRDLARKAVLSNSGATSKRVAEKYRFEMCVSDAEDIFNEPAINTVFIATRHDSHAEYTIRALTARKNVFVEKPLAITKDEFARVTQTCTLLDGSQGSPVLMVGYNRRFSQLAAALKREIGGDPMAMLYRINAGQVAPDSWIQDMETGGGRIVGEVCHFIDLLSFVCGSLPYRVCAAVLPDARHLQDTLSIQLNFENGSIGTIAYYSNGSRELEKEYMEVYSHGRTAVIRDFRKLDIYGSGSRLKRRLWSQDKGQKQMIDAFLEAIKAGRPAPIPFEHLHRTSAASFAVLESIAAGQPVALA